MARQMKDSGVEWIGEIPADWEVKPLKQILIERKEKNDPIKTNEILSLSIERGVFPYSEKVGGGNKAKDDLTAYKLAYPNDIVLNSMNIIVGAVGLSRYFGCVSPVYYTLYPRTEDFAIDYYSNIFQASAFQKSLMGYGNGIMMKESDNGKLNTIRMRIPMEKLNTVLLPVPSTKDEQQKIADFLDEKVGEIDSVIVKTKETIEDYKKYKQAIITEAVTKGLNPDVEMKESGIGWIGNIPKHWKILRMKNISEEIGDGLHSTPEYDENGDVFFVNGNNIGNEYLAIKENTNKLNEIEWKKYKLSLLNENTIMIALNGATYGKTSFYNGEKVLLGKSAGYITLREMCNKKYVRYFLQSHSAKYFMALSLNGTTIQNLSLNTLNNFYMTFPNENEQKEIAEYLDEKCSEIDKLITKKEELLVDLESYKKSFIYEYVTGKKEVE